MSGPWILTTLPRPRYGWISACPIWSTMTVVAGNARYSQRSTLDAPRRLAGSTQVGEAHFRVLSGEKDAGDAGLERLLHRRAHVLRRRVRLVLSGGNVDVDAGVDERRRPLDALQCPLRLAENVVPLQTGLAHLVVGCFVVVEHAVVEL